MSTPCSSVRRSCSQMFVFVSHTTVWCLDYIIVVLRTRLPWSRTAFSTYGWDNLFLHLLCIHPSILHIMICSDAEALVITEHNFLGNHVRLSKRTFPLSSMTCSVHIALREASFGLVILLFIYRSSFSSRIVSCQSTNSPFMFLKSGSTLLPFASLTYRKTPWLLKMSFHIVMFHVSECFVHDETNTVDRSVKGIPPCHEQVIHLATWR